MDLPPLPASFYLPSARIVARRLLGHLLLRRTREGWCGGPIVETEAYLSDDPACHGARGETARNRSMWGPSGRAYVYFIYGNYFCVNAVCQPAGVAEAVLIRAIEPLIGREIMEKNRRVSDPRLLTNGPGKLCLAMDIKRELDRVDMTDSASPLQVVRNPGLEAYRRRNGPVVVGKRIGITLAADLPLRFYFSKNAYVSGRRNYF